MFTHTLKGQLSRSFAIARQANVSPVFGACALLLALTAPVVNADVDDPDIFTLVAPNETVYVCGTTACGDGVYVPGGDATTRTAGDGLALFSVHEVGPAGSGFINPFLRFQHNEGSGNGSDTIETAYNTDNDDLQRLNDPVGPGQYDYENQAKDTVAGGWKGGDFNRTILFDDMLEEDGYFTFLLDINEPEGGDFSTLRLDELSFFISTSNMLGVYNPECTSGVDDVNAGGATDGSAGCFLSADNDGADTVKVWDMDLDKVIGGMMLDNVNSGSAGSGDYDLKVQLPSTIFDAYVAAHPGQDLYVYLENTAGATDDYDPDGGEAQAGFEEWAFISGSAPPDVNVPVPGTMLLTGLGLLLMGRRTRS